MAKNENNTASATEKILAEEEDAGMHVDMDETTGLPITSDVHGNFIPKIPKAFFFGEHVKVDGYEKKLAFLTYAVKMLTYRLEEHRSIKDPAKAKELKIAKLKAELARLIAAG